MIGGYQKRLSSENGAVIMVISAWRRMTKNDRNRLPDKEIRS
jgi:hypothetical protein